MKKIHIDRKEYLKNYNKLHKEKQKEYHKLWYLKNKEKILKKQKQYQLEHKEEKKERDKKWREKTKYNQIYYQQNKESRTLYNKNYWENNRELLIEKNKSRYDPIKRKENYLKNRDKNLKRVKEWRLKNKEYIKQYRKEFEARPERIAYHKQWNKENPRSRAGNYPLEMEIAMNLTRKKFNNICQWYGCGLNHKQAPIHVHHIFPRSEYPELEADPRFMILYCLNHHAMFHLYRGDEKAYQILAASITQEID